MIGFDVDVEGEIDTRVNVRIFSQNIKNEIKKNLLEFTLKSMNHLSTLGTRTLL